jgi:hypothetical protein
MDFNLKFQLNSACSTEDVSEKSDSENTKDVGVTSMPGTSTEGMSVPSPLFYWD